MKDVGLTICDYTVDCVSDIAEVSLDSIIQEGVLRDIPVISTLINAYKIGNTVRDAHLIKKYACFIDEFNRDSDKRGVREKYRKHFNESNWKKDIEYLLIMLDRFAEEEKAVRLARVYEAYLDETIGWDELRTFTETLDRFLPGDYETLRSQGNFQTFKGKETESLLRLTGLGLLIEEIRRSTVKQSGGTISIDDAELLAKEERNYRRTDYGNKMVSILR